MTLHDLFWCGLFLGGGAGTHIYVSLDLGEITATLCCTFDLTLASGIRLLTTAAAIPTQLQLILHSNVLALKYETGWGGHFSVT